MRCIWALALVMAAAGAQGNGEAARTAMSERRYADAVRLYREMVKAAPNDAGLRLNLIVALEKAGRPAEAVTEAQWVTRTAPREEAGWLLLGLAYQQLNQPAKALGPLRQALQLNPNDRTAAFELADAELTTGAFRDAAGHFEALTQRDAGDTKAWEGLVRAYLALNDMQKAEQGLAKLSSLPPSSELHALAADAYAKMKRRMDAVEEWRKALEMSPRSALYRARLAEALITARVYPEAESLLTPLVAAQPENGEWQYLLGNALLQQKRDQEALPHLETAVERRAGFLPAEEALGRCYLDLGRPEDAVKHLEKARPLDDGSLSFALSSAYRKLGRAEDAAKAMSAIEP